MESKDFQPEEFLISVSIGLAFHSFDLVVGAFQWPCGDGVVVVGQDSKGVKTKRLRKFVQYLDAAGFGVGDPVHKQRLGSLLVVLFPDLVEFLLEIISHSQRLIQSQGFLEALRFLADRIEVFRPLEQQPAYPFEHVLLHRVLEFAVHGARSSESLSL